MVARRSEAVVETARTPSEAVEELLARKLNRIFSEGGWNGKFSREEGLVQAEEVVQTLPPFLWHGACNIERLIECLRRNWNLYWDSVSAHKTPANRAVGALLTPCFRRGADHGSSDSS